MVLHESPVTLVNVRPSSESPKPEVGRCGKMAKTSTLLTSFYYYYAVCVLLIGSDLLRLCREDLIQICGTADGIRLYNALQAKYDFI